MIIIESFADVRTIDLSTRLLSEAIWGRVFEHSASRYLDFGPDLFRTLGRLDVLREKAQYKTGSIGTAAQWSLYALSYLWRPEVVVEIGTYIGKSTIAMALGADAASVKAEIHTCDMSNAFDLPTLSKSSVVQYPSTSSTQMLNELVEDGYKARVQLFHIDGRLTKEDISLMADLASPDAMIVLDDFEGAEKGVANLFNIRAAQVFKGHLTVYPPSESRLNRLGFWDAGSSGLLVPGNLLRFTPQ